MRLRFRRYRNCNTAFRASAARKFELSIPPRWAVRFFCTRLESRVNKRPSRRRRQTDTTQFCVLPNSFEPHFCVPCGQPSLGRPAPPGLSTWPCRPSAPCPPPVPAGGSSPPPPGPPLSVLHPRSHPPLLGCARPGLRHPAAAPPPMPAAPTPPGRPLALELRPTGRCRLFLHCHIRQHQYSISVPLEAIMSTLGTSVLIWVLPSVIIKK